MDTLVTTFRETGQLHHAYLIINGNGAEVVEFLENDVGLKTSGNPDFQEIKLPTMNIEYARDLVAAQGMKDIQSGRKIFIIHTDFITEEAQNALLKVFEEPTVGTHFFILTPQDAGFLPTLLSRMVVIRNIVLEIAFEKGKSILKMNMAERLGMVKKITEEIGEGLKEQKTKKDAIIFLNSIEY
jgi:hypothetical protein